MNGLNPDTMTLRLDRPPGSNNYRIFIFGPTAETRQAGWITFEPLPPGAVAPVAAELDDTAAQILIDDLYDAGLRPRRRALAEDAADSKAMSATRAHLADLQEISHKLIDHLIGPPQTTLETNRLVFEPARELDPDEQADLEQARAKLAAGREGRPSGMPAPPPPPANTTGY